MDRGKQADALACAIVHLSAAELSRVSRTQLRKSDYASPFTIWSLEPFLTDSEWRLLYRIVELGGQVSIYTAEPNGKSMRIGKRLSLYRERLPDALTSIHIEETMNPEKPAEPPKPPKPT